MTTKRWRRVIAAVGWWNVAGSGSSTASVPIAALLLLLRFGGNRAFVLPYPRVLRHGNSNNNPRPVMSPDALHSEQNPDGSEDVEDETNKVTGNEGSESASDLPPTAAAATRKTAAFDAAVLGRYACKRFKRFGDEQDGVDGSKIEKHNATKEESESSTMTTASSSDPAVVQKALRCLEIAQRSPSAFNTQPYKVVLVHSPNRKRAVSRYCLGPNARRVLDADCTAIFLADRQVLRTLPRYSRWLREGGVKGGEYGSDGGKRNASSPAGRWSRWTTRFYIAVFSSGYPLPRFMSATLSFLIRSAISVVDLLSTILARYPLPSLSSSETWASKQAAMVAMTYMLACSSRGIDTIPMEGINAGGIRRALGIPSRYAIPLIVSTGVAAHDKESGKGRNDGDASRERTPTRRYPMEEMIYGNAFGEPIQIAASLQQS